MGSFHKNQLHKILTWYSTITVLKLAPLGKYGCLLE